MEPIAIAGLIVHRDTIEHPLLGAAHVIEHAGEPITAMSAIDWDCPVQIPALAEPGRLPPGTGGALINDIARRAERAGVAALRYAGPYPTPALYRTLVRSFRASADEATFTRDVLARAMRLARDEVAVDFAPAPHTRVELAGGHAELRARVDDASTPGAVALEAATLAGTRFERGDGIARLVDGGRCEIWFGDAPYAVIAELSPAGALLAGPHAPPRLASRAIGQRFPPELRAALAGLIAELVPLPLAADADRIVRARELAWADLGTHAARRTADGFAVHAALWERIAPHGLARVALAIAEALAPVVTSAVIAELTAHVR